MRLLLISNSTNAGEPYLAYPKENIRQFLGDKPLERIVFIPFAAVTFSHDEYEDKVNLRFKEIGQKVMGIHRFKDPIRAVTEADAIVVGGGNTFRLVKMMQEMGLIQAIRERVLSGIPYIGWSAGSNVACPSLRTTNDMPILEPLSFDTLGLVPFQINPHYLDVHPEGHGGETREARIEEFIAANPNIYVIGLREGTMLRLEGDELKMIGSRPARIFHFGSEPKELSSDQDFNFLMG